MVEEILVEICYGIKMSKPTSKASDEIKQKRLPSNRTSSHVQTVTRGNKMMKEMHVIQAAEPLHRDKVPLVC